MSVFQKTMMDEQKFQKYIEKVDAIAALLISYSSCADLQQLQKIKDDFLAKIDDFYCGDRKLNIGIIGQVKAGKSSFLNTLLFNGNKVLPSAATPKTATLTKIEYGETNKLLVDYYTADEWAVLEANAKIDSADSSFEAAREIMKLVFQQGINPTILIEKGREEFIFASADELMLQLNDYVGENGRYTALVKNVTIQIKREELRDISIVDTPGLNDAIVSRTDRTRQFIEVCDIVFFLSRASQFLDKNDIRLLTAQLPQKGVRKLVMLGSRFDDGLTDTIWDYSSIQETITETQKQLFQHAKDMFSGQEQLYHFSGLQTFDQEPIFISSMCWDMAKKSAAQYDSQEQLVYDNLNEYGDITQEVLRKIGNIETVQKIFAEVVADKDETLSAKAKNFLPIAESELQTVLSVYQRQAEKNLSILQTGDRDELAQQKKMFVSQMNGIRSSMEIVFDEIGNHLESAKLNTRQQIRDASKECVKLAEQQGTETRYSHYRVSDSKWYNPFSWGTSHTETVSHESTYTYLNASDALENIRLFSIDACSSIEKFFSNSIDIISVKRKLLRVIVENFDMADDTYDPALFQLVTERTLNNIQFPVIKIDISQEQKIIASKFSGEVRDSNDRFTLQKLMFDTIQSLLESVTAQLQAETKKFIEEIDELKQSLSEELLKNIEADYDKLLAQFENKNKEIQQYEEFLAVLKTL